MQWFPRRGLRYLPKYPASPNESGRVRRFDRSGETGPRPIDHSLLALPNLTFFPGSGFLGQILREAHRAREKSDES
jgi:hypothetical protein